MDKLFEEYTETLRLLEKKLKQIPSTIDGMKNPEREALSSAASNIRFVLEWIKKAKHPDSRREITNRSRVQREVLMDPQNVEFLILQARQNLQKSRVTVDEKELLDDLLQILTTKEREAFVMIKGFGLSYQEAAYYLGYKSKGSVERLVTRALEKFIFVVRKPPNNEGEIYLQRSLFG